jgi:hypothetical protein
MITTVFVITTDLPRMARANGRDHGRAWAGPRKMPGWPKEDAGGWLSNPGERLDRSLTADYIFKQVLY